MPTSSIPLMQAGADLTAAEWIAAARQPVESMYLHVPFCFHKCHYCDFYSFVDSQDRQEHFTSTLIKELTRAASMLPRARAARPPIRTIFVGGGTPSLLRVPLWERLLSALHANFAIAPDAEFTVECNPETVTPELVATLRRGGVNRVSIGAQSFNPSHLKTLERWHDPASVASSLRLVEQGGIARRNIDLIFGTPGQTIDEWRDDLERALALDPGVEHISCYALTYEANTALTRRRDMGQITPIDEELESAMHRLTVDRLRDAGMQRYEVSNFSRAGAECRHNLAYWRQEQWLAFGPSASAHVAGARWKNLPRLSEWIAGVERNGGFAPIVDLETPDPRRAFREQLMLGLRLSEGLDVETILAQAAAIGVEGPIARSVRKYQQSGHLELDERKWKLTDAGFLIADSIAAELMSAAR